MFVVPDSQRAFESQQPVQRFVGQIPPQPSEAPWHFPAQLGVQQLILQTSRVPNVLQAMPHGGLVDGPLHVFG
jgi:hypothetical protein